MPPSGRNDSNVTPLQGNGPDIPPTHGVVWFRIGPPTGPLTTTPMFIDLLKAPAVAWILEVPIRAAVTMPFAETGNEIASLETNTIGARGSRDCWRRQVGGQARTSPPRRCCLLGAVNWSSHGDTVEHALRQGYLGADGCNDGVDTISTP